MDSQEISVQEEDSSDEWMGESTDFESVSTRRVASTSAMLPTSGLVVPSEVLDGVSQNHQSGAAESILQLPAHEDSSVRLYEAIQNGDHHSIKYLLINTQNLPISQETFTSICRMDKMDLLVLLSEKMQESVLTEHLIRIVDYGQHTILHLAIIHRWTNVIQFILNNKIYGVIRQRNEKNYNIIHLAALYNNAEALTFILNFFTPEERKEIIEEVCDTEGMNALHIAAKEGSDSIIRMLVKHIPVDSQSRTKGYTPLYYSVQSNNLSTILLLLDNEAVLFPEVINEVTEKLLTNIVDCNVYNLFVNQLLSILKNSVQFENFVNSDGKFTKISIKNPYIKNHVLRNFLLFFERGVTQLAEHPVIKMLVLITLHVYHREYAIVSVNSNQTLVQKVRNALSIHFAFFPPEFRNKFTFCVSSGVEISGSGFTVPRNILNGLLNLSSPPLGSKRIFMP